MTAKPVESKREEYRKYLERTGVMDTLTRILTGLYEESEKPTDPLGYFHKLLSEDRPDKIEHDDILKELAQEKAKVENLEKLLNEAQERIKELERVASENAPANPESTNPFAEEDPNDNNKNQDENLVT